MPVLLNTSFNNNAEPIVDSVNDAIVSFLTTDLHYLVIGDYLIKKKNIKSKQFLQTTLSVPSFCTLTQSRKFHSSSEMSWVWELRRNYDTRSVLSISPEAYRILSQADGRTPLNLLFRITERLHEMDFIDENAMFQLQLDTQVGVYGFYRDVALSVLNANLLSVRPEFLEIHNYLEQWDGYANDNSQGLAMLIQFRIALAQVLLEPIFHSCRMLDKKFEYDWVHIDIPLQALLREKNLALLLNQDQPRYSDWDTFLLTVLAQTAQKLMNKYSAQSLVELTWSKVNIADYVHPLSQGVPGAASFLNLSRDSLPGCDFCIRVNDELFGAMERLIISPGQWQDGILHIPGGQSGHPLSEHYKDQYRYWVNGQSIPFASESYRRYLSLMLAVLYRSNQ